jgi:cyanobactin maturation PatA/PatG family protease
VPLHAKSENNAVTVSSSPVASQLLPSAVPGLAPMGPHEKKAEMIMPSENLENNHEKIFTGSSLNSSPIPHIELSETTALKLSRDGPAVNPSEKEIAFSANNIQNKIVKNLNMQKMENNTTIQNAEAPATVDCVNPSQLITSPAEITPSDCGCGCGGKKEGNGENGANGNGAATEEPSTLVYALGTLGYDFGSEAHQDSFLQSMGGGNPNDPAAILKYLKESPWAAEELTWTLNIDSTPIYALYPAGTHSQQGYERIRLYLSQQESGNIQRISVPGISQGSTQLLNGYTVANLMPNLRGMYSWTTEALTAAATGAKGSNKALAENVSNFLNRIYYQMRNLGVSPQERSLNYAATNAYQVSAVFASALKENLELNDIKSEKSPICRPGSDCYDVTLSFFNPKERLTQARKEYRFTIDVSDVVPVTVGEVKAWSVYD